MATRRKGPGSGHPPLSRREIEQAELQPDVDAIRGWGEAHPDDFVQMWLEDGPPLRVVVLVSADRAPEHRRALKDLVPHPDRLSVRPNTWTKTQLEAIRGELHGMIGTDSALSGFGISDGVVEVRLRADGEALAGELCDRHGDALRITVGNFPYPLGRPMTDASGRSTALLGHLNPSGWRFPGSTARLVFTEATVASGANGSGHVVLRNEGAERLERSSEQPLVAAVVDPATGESVVAVLGDGRGDRPWDPLRPR